MENVKMLYKMSLILLGFGSKQDSRAFCLKKFLLHKVSDLAWVFCFWLFFQLKVDSSQWGESIKAGPRSEVKRC